MFKKLNITKYIAIGLIAMPAFMASALETPPLTLRPDDMFVGNPQSKVVLIEYSSTSCPHCADYHKTVYPELEKNYIDNGKILYVYRDFPTNHPGLLGAQLAHCSGKGEYFNYISTLMDSQPMWAYNHNYRTSLTNIAKLGGFTDDKIKSCFNNKTLEESILKRAMNDSKELGIDATPTFFLNGKKYTGRVSFAEFKKVIDEALRANTQPSKAEGTNENNQIAGNAVSTPDIPGEDKKPADQRNERPTTQDEMKKPVEANPNAATKKTPDKQPAQPQMTQKQSQNFDGVITGGMMEPITVSPKQ